MARWPDLGVVDANLRRAVQLRSRREARDGGAERREGLVQASSLQLREPARRQLRALVRLLIGTQDSSGDINNLHTGRVKMVCANRTRQHGKNHRSAKIIKCPCVLNVFGRIVDTKVANVAIGAASNGT